MRPLQLLREPLARGTERGRQNSAVINISHYRNETVVPDPMGQNSWLKRPPLVRHMGV
jgi:hypothetical protein